MNTAILSQERRDFPVAFQQEQKKEQAREGGKVKRIEKEKVEQKAVRRRNALLTQYDWMRFLCVSP